METAFFYSQMKSILKTRRSCKQVTKTGGQGPTTPLPFCQHIPFNISVLTSGIFFGVDSCTRNTLEIRSLPSILHFQKVRIRSGMIRPQRSKVKGSQGDPLQEVKISKWEFFFSESRFGFSSKNQLKNLLFFFSFFDYKQVKKGVKGHKRPPN